MVPLALALINEHTWSIDNDQLVIWRSDGTLQNRFDYDPVTERFVSTNDPEFDARRRGIGQFIFKHRSEGMLE